MTFLFYAVFAAMVFFLVQAFVFCAWSDDHGPPLPRTLLGRAMCAVGMHRGHMRPESDMMTMVYHCRRCGPRVVDRGGGAI